MKRFPKAALVTANILMLVALACSQDVIGPIEAALADIRELISPQKNNALEVAEDGLLYVAAAEAGVGERGPKGERGEQGKRGQRGRRGFLGLVSAS